MPGESEKLKHFEGKYFETSVGRLLFNEVLPADYPYINKEIDKKTMAAIMNDIMAKYGIENTPPILDKIKAFGFKYVTLSGITWGIDDIKVPEGKKPIIEASKKKSEEVIAQYNEGLLSEEERTRKNIEIWHSAKAQIEKIIPENLDKRGSVHDMWKSGARGSLSQITQMSGMKGLIQNTAGETIEFPIISSSKEGLNPIEYFITTHGSRKGLTDTALNTAKAGYLTRRLFVAAQDVLVTETDCGTKDGIRLQKETASGIETPLAISIKGRVLANDAISSNGKVVFEKSHLLSDKDAVLVEAAGVSEVYVRSPLTCKTHGGVCAMCYGLDLGRSKLIDLGEAVGTIAAQAIGEPGTQLTMRTFHAGGTAQIGGDITQGLPRVEEVFEKRKPKNPAVVSKVDGVVSEIKQVGKEKIIVIIPELAERAKTKKQELEHSVHFLRTCHVKVGDAVKKGQILTDGSADIEEVFKYSGKEKAQEYIISEVKKLYELQGEAVSRKHIEVIVKQMFSRLKVKDPGETSFTQGYVVDWTELAEENARMKKLKKEEAKAEPMVLGITEVSLSRSSFLSAASFQHTTRVLIAAAIAGSKDKLSGLMENVILGRLIPAGTGFKGSKKFGMVEDLQKTLRNDWEA